MQIVLAVIAMVLMIYFWIWIIHSVFKQKNLKRNISLQIFGGSLFLVAALFLYPHFLEWIGRNERYFQSEISAKNMFLFGGYCLLLLLFLMIWRKQLKNMTIWMLIVVGAFLFSLVAYGGIRAGLSTVFVSYLISAYAEELLKFGTSEDIALTKRKIDSDLIFFSLLVGLGFAVIENVFYLIASILGGENSVVGMALGRGIFSSLLHIVATGVIALLFFKGEQRYHFSEKKRGWLWGGVFLLIALFAGFSLHSFYNISLHYGWVFVYLFILIGGYFLMSYLLFESNSLYKGKSEIRDENK